MLKSRRSNPVPYRLKPVQTLRDIDRRITQVRQIFSSYRKQARAAYLFRREKIKEDIYRKFFHDADACRDGITAFHNLWDKEAAKLESLCADSESRITVNMQRILVMDDWSAQERVDTVNANLERYNQEIRLPRVNKACGLEDFLNQAYHASRVVSARKKSASSLHSPRSYKHTKFDEFKTLKMQYPYLSAKNKPRLVRLWHAYYEATKNYPKSGDVTVDMLAAAGIPASEIAGPWWTQTKTVKSPAEWVRTVPKHANRSPMIQNWLSNIGLDQHDGRLADSVNHYYRQHRRTPSAQWARERNNELEQQRREKEIAGSIETVKSWLNRSKHWIADGGTVVPPLLSTWRIVTPADARELCVRAQKDGLCVIDVICDIMNEDVSPEEDLMDDDERDIRDADPVFERSKHEGVCTILFSTDPDCRTIVGLNDDGICTSEHHCTGTNNRVDHEAWEQFKA